MSDAAVSSPPTRPSTSPYRRGEVLFIRCHVGEPLVSRCRTGVPLGEEHARRVLRE